MESNATIFKGFISLLSLKPLLVVLKKMIAEGKPGAKRLYQGLVDEIESRPHLLQPMTDTAPMVRDAELVETLLSTIFPPSTTSTEGIYAITFPFRTETIYASPEFKKLFLKNDVHELNMTDDAANEGIYKAAIQLAYNLILKKFYKIEAPASATSVCTERDAESGLTAYYELKLSTQFTDVQLKDPQHKLPEDFDAQTTMELDKLETVLPLKDFQFEGLIVIEVRNITQEQVVAEIKNQLLNINFNEASVFDDLQQHVQSLIGLRQLNIGITPFFKSNQYFLYTDNLYKNSLLFRHPEVLNAKDHSSYLCQKVFKKSDQPLLFETLNEKDFAQNRIVRYYYEQGSRSLILCPLKKNDGELIGLLEISDEQPGRLQLAHLTRIMPVIDLFELALEKSGENLELQIDKMIKEHFTAIQPAVEWKFTEAAFNYLQNRQESELAKMPNITFENVYPLYAAIDVRNSSTERSKSIQLDLEEQLMLAKSVLERATRIMDFPLLKETQFRIDRYVASVSDNLLSDDEIMIYEFMQNDLEALFKNLLHNKPELKKFIDAYNNALDPQRKMIYHHRKEYEESLTRINDVLDRFIDNEQREAQEIFPHYFERYVTDGIEFNIYIGQSLSPHNPFNEIYVRNLKLWQLTLLAKAARITATLEKRLSLPLQTTQLILAHSIPLSISFRRKERKFDVDGAYNIRYEIVKKRIDKVHLRDSDERLTQPGTVAVVYSQQKELNEYLEFIEYLQAENILGDTLEHLELEETQGISGLKAVRVNVNLNVEAPQPPSTNGTSAKAAVKQLMRK